MTTSLGTTHDVLEAILGSDRVRLIESGAEQYAPHALPLVHVMPRTREEVAEIVRAAARDGFVIVPVGGNTSPRVGPADPRVTCLLSTEYLDRVVAHEVGDLTLTVECGAGLASLNDGLRKHRQFVAMDPPDPERATIGGIIAAASDGPLASRFGHVRDQVLGLVVVGADGRVTKCGGRVVKNVTGYDLCRLYTGSRGALAIILEATVRLRPTPEASVRLVMRHPTDDGAFEAAMALRAGVPDLAALHLLGGAAAADLGIEEGAAVVASVMGMKSLVGAVIDDVRARASVPVEVQDAGIALAPSMEAPPNDVVLRVASLPASWRGLRASVVPRLAPARGVVHDVLSGVRESWFEPGSSPIVDPRNLELALVAAGATIDMPREPSFHLTLADRFPSQVPGGIDVMRGLKATLDPARLLNPGRTIFG